MTQPIAPSIEHNQTNWKEIRPILSSLNIYPIDGGSEMTDGKQQRHFGKVIKQIAENGLAGANVRVPKEF